MASCKCGHEQESHDGMKGRCEIVLVTGHDGYGTPKGLSCDCYRFKEVKEGEAPRLRFRKEYTDTES